MTADTPPITKAESVEWEVVDTKQHFTVADVCAWFGVPEHLVYPAPHEQPAPHHVMTHAQYQRIKEQK